MGAPACQGVIPYSDFPELVEGLIFFWGRGEEGQGFDKLSQAGLEIVGDCSI